VNYREFKMNDTFISSMLRRLDVVDSEPQSSLQPGVFFEKPLSLPQMERTDSRNSLGKKTLMRTGYR
jgi:hypothetical protein